MNHKSALHFSSERSRATDNFNSNLTTWRKDFWVSSTVCYGLMHSNKPCPLIICKGRRTPEKIFLKWNDKIIIGWKAIHHHRTDQNPHQRWSDLQWKPALHHPSDRGRDQLFSRASGAEALDAFCTHSAEMDFSPNLSVIWARFYQSMPILMVKQVKVSRRPCRGWRVTSDGRADRFAIFHPKWVLLPLCRLRGLSKRKDIPKDLFTMEDKKKSCNGIITFEEAYRYQKS